MQDKEKGTCFSPAGSAQGKRHRCWTNITEDMSCVLFSFPVLSSTNVSIKGSGVQAPRNRLLAIASRGSQSYNWLTAGARQNFQRASPAPLNPVNTTGGFQALEHDGEGTQLQERWCAPSVHVTYDILSLVLSLRLVSNHSQTIC
eukprot:230511-Pelagomonas_calceolata.AAC.4